MAYESYINSMEENFFQALEEMAGSVGIVPIPASKAAIFVVSKS